MVKGVAIRERDQGQDLHEFTRLLVESHASLFSPGMSIDNTFKVLVVAPVSSSVDSRFAVCFLL